MNNDQLKPPARLSNGQRNPEWTKWYYSTPKGKAALAKYRESDKGKETRSRYNSKPETKEKKATAQLQKFPMGTRKCIDCGIIYPSEIAIDRGYRLIGRYNCLCDLCN